MNAFIDKIKLHLAWIGICAIVFIFAWVYRGCEKDKEFASMPVQKDTTMVTQHITFPNSDTTVHGKDLKDSIKYRLAQKKIDSLTAEVKKMKSVASIITENEKQAWDALDSLSGYAGWLSLPFRASIRDTIGLDSIEVYPAQRDIRRIFFSGLVPVQVPQIIEKKTLSTGIDPWKATEIGFGGMLLGGAIAKDKTVIAAGAGGIVLVEIGKLIF